MASGVLRRDQAGKWAALFANNIGSLEDEVAGLSEEWQATRDVSDDLQGVLAELDDIVQTTDLSREGRINRPNLIKQPQFVSRDVPAGTVIYDEHTIAAEPSGAAADTYTITDAGITAAMVLHQYYSSDYDVCHGITVTCSAGSAVVSVPAREAHSSAITLRVYLCEVTSALLPYGEISRWYASSQPYLDSFKNGDYAGQELDEISESVVQLRPAAYDSTAAYSVGDVCSRDGKQYQCGTAIASGGETWNPDHWTEVPRGWLIDADGEEYPQAVAFTVVNPPTQGWGNCDKFVWNFGNGMGAVEMENGEPKYHRYCQLDAMEVGKTYTLTCWARVTSGTKACLWMGASPVKGNHHIPDGRAYIEIGARDGAWQRVHFTFDFNPDCAQFETFDTTETRDVEGVPTQVTVTYQTAMWLKQVGIGVCRKYAGTVQLCGFRLVEGGLCMPTQYDRVMSALKSLEARVDDLEGAVSALEAIVTENGASE